MAPGSHLQSTLNSRLARSPRPGRGVPVLVFLLAIAGVTSGRIAPLEAGEEPVSYLEDVRPLLARKCLSCHGVLRQKADLRLDTRAGMLEGGRHGPAIRPGEPEESRLLARVTAKPDERMPPAEEGAPLTPEEVDLLRRWILAGAPAPAEEPPVATPDRHWAFQPLELDDSPEIEGESPADGPNPIDAWFEKRHAEKGLVAVDLAPRSLALRRLYLDLVGLPPTLEQLDDPRPWGEIVDDLLESPHHAERWARHWMDIWRYSDGYGLGEQLRNSQKHMWRWRDWIVDSLEADRGYDRMILEMLAGDEIAPEDPRAVQGTAFLARNYYLFNRTTWLDSTIEHTGKAFLGLTLECAKCHDHKYDPISQEDYYRFRAFFEPHQVRLDPVPGSPDAGGDGMPRVFDDQLEAPTYLHVKGDPKKPDESRPLTPGVPRRFAGFEPEIRPVELPLLAWAPGLRPHVRQDLLRAADKKIAVARGELEKLEQAASSLAGAASPELVLARARLRLGKATREALEARLDADRVRFTGTPDSEILREPALRAATAEAREQEARAALALLEAGEDAKKKKQANELAEKAKQSLEKLAASGDTPTYTSIRASRKALETPAHRPDQYPVTHPRTSTGRRTALARWIVAPENPLTARVAVNHVWLRHFGRPLVEPVEDFGLRTPEPEHRGLLDALAVSFVRSGWSLRHLHRLIVTSKTYRLASSRLDAAPRNLEIDPGNHQYWRMQPRRMESQVIRDSLLYLGQALDLTRGGPSIDPGPGGRRRSLYFLHDRDHQNRFLSMFDDADHLRCYRRPESIVPQQALAMSNSQVSLEMSGHIARHLETRLEASAPERAFIEVVFEALLGRTPAEDEVEACRAYLARLTDHLRERELTPERLPARRHELLVHAILNHNDFITIR